MNFETTVANLAPVETFDAQAFIGGADAPQHVCDFVLSLALAFNDLRDLMNAQRLIRELRPTVRSQSPAWGEYAGLHAHWLRLLSGVLNELAEIIKDNEAAIGNSLFQKVLKQVAKTYREAWHSTVTAATSTSPQGDRFGRLIFFARNKVAFHYDQKAITKGYRQFFLERARGVPCISRGQAMKGTRFYFADAAAEEYLMHAAEAKDADEFFDAGWRVLPDIGHSLREIVMGFITVRGFAWRAAAT